MSVPEGCPPPLQRRFYNILKLSAMGLILLPWEYGGASLASRNIFVADTGCRLIQQLKQNNFINCKVLKLY